MKDDEETSLMDELAAAWDVAEEETDDSPVVEEEPVEEAPADTSDDVAVDTPEEFDTAAEDLSVAPKGLSPAAREAWANTPDSVKTELAKREKDFEKGIQKYAEQAKRAEAMDRVLSPYQPLFAMNGGPANTLPGLLATAQSLQTGSEHVRAQAVANIIQQFGVSVHTLADILEGKTRKQPQKAPQVDIQAEIQKAVAPFYQQEQQRQQGAIQSELQSFAAENEFYADVRGEMADLMDIAAKNGRTLSLKDAYSKACLLRDDVRQVIQTRESTGQVGARRIAASSISGAPRGAESRAAPDSTRDYLEQAWDMVGKRR